VRFYIWRWGRKYVWNVGELLAYYTAQHPRRQPFSYSPWWESEISQSNFFVCAYNTSRSAVGYVLLTAGMNVLRSGRISPHKFRNACDCNKAAIKTISCITTSQNQRQREAATSGEAKIEQLHFYSGIQYSLQPTLQFALYSTYAVMEFIITCRDTLLLQK
jgi:hypothetical protein